MDWEIWGFVGGCAAFLALAFLGALNFSWISTPSALSLGIYLLGTCLVVGGYFVGKRAKLPYFPLLWGVLLFAVLGVFLFTQYGPMGIVAAYLLTAAVMVVIDKPPGRELAGLGVAAMAVNLYYSGIPLFDPSIRAGYSVLGALGLILVLLGVNVLADARDKSWWWFFGAAAILSVLSGYRAAVLLVVLSTLITLNLNKRIDVKRWVIYLAALAIVVMFVGQINAFEGEANPYLLASRRAGFTYERFDQIINTLSGEQGLWIMPEPRYIVGELTLGEHKIINPGIYGFLWLDGGILELVSGCVLVGMALGHMRQNREKIRPFYGIFWIYFMISIDAGFDIVYLCGFIGALFAISWKGRYLTC